MDLRINQIIALKKSEKIPYTREWYAAGKKQKKQFKSKLIKTNKKSKKLKFR